MRVIYYIALAGIFAIISFSGLTITTWQYWAVLVCTSIMAFAQNEE